ncbi:MAG: amidohydrolase [Eubacteriales bacterium]|nr:amidohydrolase [Eubacteriales bacterium]
MVRELAKKYRPYMVEVRRYLHMHPELSFQEHETCRFIQAELTKMAIPFLVIEGTTNIVATITGAKPGKMILLRADMDALPVQELNDCAYQSQTPGVMHACGHDGHVAALLGAAKILLELREQIQGTVKLLFESGEEFRGSFEVVEQSGVLEGIDHCFGIHIWAEVPVGKLSCQAGARMAGTELFTLEVTGKGAHASAPQQGVDALVAAAAIVMNLQTIVSRELSPQDTGVVTIGKMTAGQRFNVIAEKATLEGNLRYFDPRLEWGYRDMILRIAEHTAAAYRAQCEMTLFGHGTPALINAPSDAAFGQKVATALFGDDVLYDLPPLMAGEDFAFYIDKLGGTFVFVGGGFTDRENASHHNGRFDIDEDSLPIASAMHAQYALDWLAAHS